MNAPKARLAPSDLTAPELAAEEIRQQFEILQNDSSVENAKEIKNGGVIPVYFKAKPAEASKVTSIKVRRAVW